MWPYSHHYIGAYWHWHGPVSPKHLRDSARLQSQLLPCQIQLDVGTGMDGWTDGCVDVSMGHHAWVDGWMMDAWMN